MSQSPRHFPERPQQPLDPDPLYVDPRVPTPYRRTSPPDDGNAGCIIVAIVGIALAVLIVVAIVWSAAPRSGQTTGPVDVSGISSAAQSGAPHNVPEVGGVAPRATLGWLGGAPLAATSQRTGWATWYDDGPGLYAAVPSWRWGDKPYTIQVTAFEGGRANAVLVTVRDFCACGARGGIPTVIDLSPAAFRVLAPLSKGVIRVVIDDPRAVPVAPPTDTEEETP